MEFVEKQEISTNAPIGDINKFCILLTSTVYINPKKRFIFDTEADSRLNTYLASIKQWLDKNNFKIVIIIICGISCVRVV